MKFFNFKQVHGATPYDPNYVVGMTKNLEFMANPHVIWETLLATLRGTIIQFAKKRHKNNCTRELENEITILDKLVTSGSANMQHLEELYELNNKLLETRREELKGALIRSRAEWLDLGEKNKQVFPELR